MKTFVEKYVGKLEKIDLDLAYPNYSGDTINDVMIPKNRLSYAVAPSIAIDEVINILNQLKTKGANRVYIADHSDHHGYYFYGVELKEI